MPCLFAFFAFFAPRLVLVVLWLFSSYLEKAYDGFLIPVLGFLFMPMTTLTYAWCVHAAGGVKGPLPTVAIVVAVLIDLGSTGEAERHRRRRRA